MICLIGGEEKTGKSTLALTFPKPMVYHEFDIGGYDRAKKSDTEYITLHKYTIPLQASMKNGTMVPSKTVIGIKELWYKFLYDFNQACLNDDVKTIVIDTWYQLWEVARLGVLQEKQELQFDDNGQLKKGETKIRTALLQIEYGEPNARMRNIMFYAKGMNKHLVLVTYDKDEYKPQIDPDGRLVEVRTGKKLYAGWSETQKHADIALWNRLENGVFTTEITLPGVVPMEYVGMKFEDFSYDLLAGLIHD